MIKKSVAALLSFAIILTFFFTGCGQQENITSAQDSSAVSPLLWKAEGKNGNSLYLFGTIHCGDERSSAVLEKLGDILDDCPVMAVEFDVVKYNEKVKSDPLSAADDIAQFMYLDGTTVKDHLPEKLYKDCVKILEDAGTYNSLYDYYTPALWTQLVTQALIQQSDLSTDNAMDTLLLNRAHANDTKIVELESAKKQYKIMADFSDELCELQLKEAVKSKDTYNAQLGLLYDVWLRGDEKALEKLVISEEVSEKEQKYVDEYNKSFLKDRNRGMAEKAEKLLKGSDDAFLAVGAAHMLNDYGIIQLLKDKGYKVEKVNTQ